MTRIEPQPPATLRSIAILEREHRWIGWMTECLEALIARAHVDDQLPAETYELLRLFESFADGLHQDKEEHVLFVHLLDVARGNERDALTKLLTDHEAERRHLSGMRVNVLGAVHGEPGCVREFVREAEGYLGVHRAHMARESKVLFPLAARVLTPDADAQVVRGFGQVDASEEGGSATAGLLEQIVSLRRRIGLPSPPAA